MKRFYTLVGLERRGVKAGQTRGLRDLTRASAGFGKGFYPGKKMRHNINKMMLFFGLLGFLAILVAGEEAGGNEGPGLRHDEDVDKRRSEAIAKVEEEAGKELSKFKVKELKNLLTERGMTCTACSEKDQLLKTVRESMHLPIKKDHLKKINLPKSGDDPDLQDFMRELKAKQKKEQELKDMLKAKGINTDNINFGGSNFDPEMLEKIVKQRGSEL